MCPYFKGKIFNHTMLYLYMEEREMSQEELEHLKRVLHVLEKLGYIENKGIDIHTLRIISDNLYESGYDYDQRLIIRTLAKLGYTRL